MKLKRKDFLRNLALGAAGMIANPFGGKVMASAQENQMTDSHPVIRIKPLGFVWETADPFLFCVHHEDRFPRGNSRMGPLTPLDGRNLGDDFIIKDGFRMYHGKEVPGFPGHPHRGFETITVVREGIVDHADSLGASGRYGDGDVQWMTAGKGIQHSEMFPLIHEEKENPMELFQIWLNLPRKNKMVDPHYKMLWRETIPVALKKDAKGNEVSVEVIAGPLWGKVPSSPPPDSWASVAEHEVAVWNFRIAPNAVFELPRASAGINRTLYFYQGKKLGIAGQEIPGYHAVEVKPDQELLIVNGDHPSALLVLQGKPIGEPVIQYGPFVMNTKEEIHQAFEDYHATQFGGWPWPRYDQVHDRNKGRFARHSDGKEENRL